MPELNRLKPDPLPVIHPVPEHVATGALAVVYNRTKACLGVPWMGVVAMAFAHYPRFYEALWSGLEPMVGGASFAEACENLRTCAEASAAALSPPTILPRLREAGYETAEIDEIRACNEVFSAGNMPYLLMATLARLLLEQQAWTGAGSVGQPVSVDLGALRPPLIEPHHADPTIAAVYRDIRNTLELPFVNTDYRAFARWPSYFEPAWGDLKAALRSDDYERRAASVYARSIDLAAGLPNPTKTTSDSLREAAQEDATIDEVLAVVRLFQWLLPGLALNVAFLRAQLMNDGPATLTDN